MSELVLNRTKKRVWLALFCVLSACGGEDSRYEGTLEDTDQRLHDGSLYDWFEVELDEGDVVNFSLQSQGFEPTLFLFDPAHRQLEEQIGESGMVSLRHQASLDGSYAIVVNASVPNTAGTYTLSVQVGAP